MGANYEYPIDHSLKPYVHIFILKIMIRKNNETTCSLNPDLLIKIVDSL